MEARHRLYATDLQGRAHTLTIARITMEGVESTRPLAYFRGVNLPLALSPAQCNDLARISGSALLQDWAGLTVVLDPVETESGLVCVIRAPGEPTSPRRRQAIKFELDPRVRLILFVMLLMLIAGLVVQAEESRALLDWILALRAGN